MKLVVQSHPLRKVSIKARPQGIALVTEGVHHRPRDLEGPATLDVAIAQHSEPDEPGAKQGRPASVSHAPHLLNLVLQVRDHWRGHCCSLVRLHSQRRVGG